MLLYTYTTTRLLDGGAPDRWQAAFPQPVPAAVSTWPNGCCKPISVVQQQTHSIHVSWFTASNNYNIVYNYYVELMTQSHALLKGIQQSFQQTAQVSAAEWAACVREPPPACSEACCCCCCLPCRQCCCCRLRQCCCHHQAARELSDQLLDAAPADSMQQAA